MKVQLLRAWGNFPKGKETTIADLEGERLVKAGVARRVGTTSHTPYVPTLKAVSDEASVEANPPTKTGRKSKAAAAKTENAGSGTTESN